MTKRRYHHCLRCGRSIGFWRYLISDMCKPCVKRMRQS